jgi:hypothetical protein
VFEGLFTQLIDFDADLFRNIKGMRVSQDLFDDLADRASHRAVAMAATMTTKPHSPSPLLTRPFDYGTALTHPFQSENWHETRFSDGTAFGVWYGSQQVKTTVFETVYHWTRFVLDSFPDCKDTIISERRVFRAHCRGLLVDLRDKHLTFPQLIDPSSYEFSNQVGAYLYERHANGLLVKSARCDGINGDVLNADALSNPRDHCYLTYSWRPDTPYARIERTPGRAWMKLPITLG